MRAREGRAGKGGVGRRTRHMSSRPLPSAEPQLRRLAAVPPPNSCSGREEPKQQSSPTKKKIAKWRSPRQGPLPLPGHCSPAAHPQKEPETAHVPPPPNTYTPNTFQPFASLTAGNRPAAHRGAPQPARSSPGPPSAAGGHRERSPCRQQQPPAVARARIKASADPPRRSGGERGEPRQRQGETGRAPGGPVALRLGAGSSQQHPWHLWRWRCPARGHGHPLERPPWHRDGRHPLHRHRSHLQHHHSPCHQALPRHQTQPSAHPRVSWKGRFQRGFSPRQPRCSQ